MSRYERGMRVGAIMGAKGGVVEFFGYGVYEGDYPYGDEACGWVRNMIKEAERMVEEEGVESPFDIRNNPRIRLDSGKVVWGCECWWGPEKAVRKKMEGLEIVEVDIDEVRAKIRAAEKAETVEENSDGNG